jgi:hypothetical protein
VDRHGAQMRRRSEKDLSGSLLRVMTWRPSYVGAGARRRSPAGAMGSKSSTRGAAPVVRLSILREVMNYFT